MSKPPITSTEGFRITRAIISAAKVCQEANHPNRWMTRRTIAAATRLVTNSSYSMAEIEANLGLGPDRVAVVHHGIPDRFGAAAPPARHDRMALSVGVVYRVNLERKGHRPFVAAARHLPDVEFVLAGKWSDDAIAQLRAEAGPNVTFTGYLDDEALDDYFVRAAVYVQPSQHEGSGSRWRRRCSRDACPS